MPWHDDILENLPPPSPRGGEPARLRRDILDELADHLDCAVQRELRKTDDETQARRAAAARFGDPKQIARRLWLDAMKEQIMSQRMMMGTQIVLAAMVIVLGVVVFTQYQGQKNQQAMLEQLRMMGEQARADREATMAKAATSFEWPTFRVQVTQPDGKAGIAGVRARLFGDAYNEGKPRDLDKTTDAQGMASFGPMRPGGYTLRVSNDQGIAYVRSIIVPPGAEQPPLVIPWLELPPKPVQATLKTVFPNDVPMDRIHWLVSAVLESRPPQDGKTEGYWEFPAIQVLMDDRGRVATLPYGGDGIDRSRRDMTPKYVSDLPWASHLTLNASLEYMPSHGSIWVSRKTSGEAASYGLISTFSNFASSTIRLAEPVGTEIQAVSLEPPQDKLVQVRMWIGPAAESDGAPSP